MAVEFCGVHSVYERVGRLARRSSHCVSRNDEVKGSSELRRARDPVLNNGHQRRCARYRREHRVRAEMTRHQVVWPKRGKLMCL